ncbi:hypothetical protein PMAC_002139 [Pneumocystis sp. 'macacae']|nr:hypothetical protein PMAC_002139 [Pneumocystis sp. 'macacae']
MKSEQGISECARGTEVGDVHSRGWARVGEVGCEKNVYGADEVVCTKQLVGVRVRATLRAEVGVHGVQIRGGGVGGGSRDGE